MNQYQTIFKDIQKAIIKETIHLIPEFRGKILRNCVNEIVKIIRIERAKAKKELILRVIEESDAYSVNRDNKKFIEIDDLKYLLENLQRESFLLKKELPNGKI